MAARGSNCVLSKYSTRVSNLQLCKLGDKFKPIAGRPSEAWQTAKEKSKHGLKHAKKTNTTANQRREHVGNWLSKIRVLSTGARYLSHENKITSHPILIFAELNFMDYYYFKTPGLSIVDYNVVGRDLRQRTFYKMVFFQVTLYLLFKN